MTTETTTEFSFDLILVCALTVPAPNEMEARKMLGVALDAADTNFGAWPNGSPILGEVSVDGTPQLYAINGEHVDMAPAAQLEYLVTLPQILPPDPEDMNEERAVWAGSAIAEFRRVTGTDEEDAVCDLIANLRHFCDRSGIDFASEVARANQHYEAEIGR